jgi:hypothetical protein
MNDLITALKAKATKRTVHSGPFGLQQVNNKLDLEKFTELLIKECADCSYHVDRDSGPITADLIKVRIMSLIGV